MPRGGCAVAPGSPTIVGLRRLIAATNSTNATSITAASTKRSHPGAYHNGVVGAARQAHTRNTIAPIETSEKHRAERDLADAAHQRLAQRRSRDADMDGQLYQSRNDQQAHAAPGVSPRSASLARGVAPADHAPEARGNQAMQYTPPPHLTQNWVLSKPSASGRRGIVVSQAKGAAEAGVAVLDAGGNAIDAAVATALALATVEPWNSGLGGIGFALVHRAGQSRAEVVDFGPRAPRNTDPARYKLTGRMTTDLFAWPEVEGDINIHGPLSVAIPASVAGYAYLHQHWGQLPLADVIAPAIALAKRGLPQDWYTAVKISNAAAVIRKYPETAKVYLPNGLPPAPPYQGTPGILPPGQSRCDTGTARPRRAARLLRGRGRPPR